MLEQVQLSSDLDVLEPAGGEGAFVKGLLRQGLSADQITVWDLDPARKDQLEKLGVKVVIQDSLLDVDFRNPRRQFDLIVGNPPYLAKQSDYIQAHKQQLRKRFPEISAAETYGLFLFMGVHLLRPGGELIFILSDSYRSIKTHEKLRAWLLEHTRIEQIAVMPPDLFDKQGASVRTSILHLTKTAAPQDHKVVFHDFRDNRSGSYDAPTDPVAQRQFRARPGKRLTRAQDPDLTRILSHPPGRLLDRLVGGIGLHTSDNARYMARIQYPGESLTENARTPRIISARDVENPDTNWRVLHKRGGRLPFWARPRYAIRWDEASQQEYMGPADFWRLQRLRQDQPAVLVSGVAEYLNARLGQAGGVWYSNKCFAFFPKDSDEYPALFFVGLLNSALYRRLMKVISHTNSMQLSDLRALPGLEFSPGQVQTITRATSKIVEALQNGETPPEQAREKLNDCVQRRFRTVAEQAVSGEDGSGIEELTLPL